MIQNKIRLSFVLYTVVSKKVLTGIFSSSYSEFEADLLNTFTAIDDLSRFNRSLPSTI